MIATDAASRRSRAKSDRREQLIRAAERLIAENGYLAVRLEDIGAAAGVSGPAIYRHFPNKEAIWQAVMKWVANRLMARIDKAAEGIESPLAAMRSMFLAHVAFVSEHPGAPRMLFGELQGAKPTPAKRLARAMMKQYGVRLNHLIEDGKACGELAEDLDSQAAATLFIGTIQGLVMQSLMSGDMERMRADAPRVFAIYQRGIATKQDMAETGRTTS